MDIVTEVGRLQLLNKLVKERRTGTPEELARRLNVSRAKLYLMLEELKDVGVAIKYSKKMNTFYYDNCGGLSLVFSLEVIDLDESLAIKGGKISGFFPASNFLDRSMFSSYHDRLPNFNAS